MSMTCLWKIISASVLLLAVVSVIAKPSQLASDECLDETSWPDPTNCSRYYVCAPWGPQIMDCAPGTHYNPKLQVCDWPEAVGCVVSTTSTEAPPTIPNTRPPWAPTTDAPSTEGPSTEGPSTEEPSTEEPSTEESTESSEEPTETPVETTEDPTETEEPSTESPEETGTPELAEPTETPEPEPTTSSEPEPTATDLPEEPTTIISPSPSAICGEFPNLFFVTSHPSDCEKFIACSDGEPNILDCPSGQFFSSLISSCVTDSSHCT